MWVLYALLGAVFAAFTSVLGKLGVKNVDSNLAVAIRTIVVLLMSWIIVFYTGSVKEISEISKKSWLFLGLSGLATGLSWIFFYKALSTGDASRVVPIDKFSIVITLALSYFILKEPFTIKTIIGGGLITIGTFVLIF